MAGADDLIAAALPYLATENIVGTAGTTWQWEYKLFDSTGAVVDLTTGFTGTCGIVDQSSYASVITTPPTVSFPVAGIVRCKSTPTQSVVTPGTYFHEVTITRTSDSAKFIIVGAGGGKFVVKKKAT